MLKIGDTPKFPLTSDACQICGRQMTDDGTAGKAGSLWVHLSIDGQILPLDYEGTESQGCWQVGSSCAKQIEAGLITKQ